MTDDRNLRLLLIEDNRGDARLVKEMLQETTGRWPSVNERMGGGTDGGPRTGTPTILHAERLDAGLQRLDDTPVDIVLLDLGLPDSTGLDTLGAVLEHAATVPIVVLTGLTDETVGVQAVQQGAQSYLVKDELSSALLVRSLRHAWERHERETQLTALSTVSQELMAATTADDIADLTVTAAADILGFPVALVCRYDTDQGQLRPCAATARADDLLLTEEPTGAAGGVATHLAPSCAAIVGQVFATNQAAIETDDGAQFGSVDTDSPLQRRIVLPLASQGVFLVGSTTATPVLPTEIEYAKILATNAQTALERLAGEQQLRDREATLEAQTETLERLDRINAVIRDIVQGIVHASTRTEIEHAVCERLATSGPVRFVWIGAHDALTQTLTPRARAGVEDGYLDSVAITTDDSPTGQGPVGTAIRTRDLQVVEDAVQDLPHGPWREAALQRGYRAIASIPLVYADTLYGVLTMYADEPGIFTDQEQAVLAELGETIAHAINAVESKQALISDRVVELEFQVRDREMMLLDLTAAVDCTATVESVIPRMDDRLRVFFSTRGASVDEVLAYAEQALAIDELTLVTEREADCVFECTLRGPSLVSFCLEHGVLLQTLTADRGEGQVLVELSSDANVRGFAEQFQARYPETTLVASREAERSVQTRQAVQATLDERLTDRQAEVLRTALFSGYFESPRESSGRDVAATLDIAQPTFNHHLRAALRKVLTLLYTE